MADMVKIPKDRLIQAMQMYCILERDQREDLGEGLILSTLLGVTVSRLNEMARKVLSDDRHLDVDYGQALYAEWYGSTRTE